MKQFFSVIGLIAFMGLGGGIFWFGNDMRTEAREAQFWPATEATVIRSQWWGTARDHADIGYRYEVDGTTYESDQQFIGAMEDGAIELNNGKRLRQFMLLDRFPLGRKITIHYDPTDPENAVLYNRVDSNGTVITYFGIAFMLVGFLGLVRLCFLWNSQARRPRRKPSRA